MPQNFQKKITTVIWLLKYKPKPKNQNKVFENFAEKRKIQKMKLVKLSIIIPF